MYYRVCILEFLEWKPNKATATRIHRSEGKCWFINKKHGRAKWLRGHRIRDYHQSIISWWSISIPSSNRHPPRRSPVAATSIGPLPAATPSRPTLLGSNSDALWPAAWPGPGRSTIDDATPTHSPTPCRTGAGGRSRLAAACTAWQLSKSARPAAVCTRGGPAIDAWVFSWIPKILWTKNIYT